MEELFQDVRYYIDLRIKKIKLKMVEHLSIICSKAITLAAFLLMLLLAVLTLTGTLGLTITKRLVVSRTTEYITVANEKGRQLGKGYYFDYSRVFWGNQDNIPQPEHHWKINDYPVGGYKKK